MAPRILKTSVRVLPNATVLDLEGGIDIGNSPGLRATLFEKILTTPRLVLNMTAIRYIDSSGIATLIQGLKKAQDLRKVFVLFGLGPAVHDVLKLTNLLGVFQIVEDEERALETDAAV
jgi:anti-sigma B factor antagonist